jgi:rhomboid protease GluP
VILAVNLLVFGSAWLLGRDLILGMGAKINQAILASEVWRLGTAMFLHVDLLHIGFNSYALLAFGLQVERPYGRPRFLLMYCLSGLTGSALSFLLSPHPSVGASGAIFGLVGVTGAYLYRYRDRLIAGRARLGNILSIVAYNLIYGFLVPAVDNWAHIGGLLAGLTLGWFLAPRYQTVRPDPLGPPQLVDRGSPLHWLSGIGLVGLGIGLALLGGFLRWGG